VAVAGQQRWPLAALWLFLSFGGHSWPLEPRRLCNTLALHCWQPGCSLLGLRLLWSPLRPLGPRQQWASLTALRLSGWTPPPRPSARLTAPGSLGPGRFWASWPGVAGGQHHWRPRCQLPPSWSVRSGGRPRPPWARAAVGLLVPALLASWPAPVFAGIRGRGRRASGPLTPVLPVAPLFFFCAGDVCSSPVATGPLYFHRADLQPRQLLVRPPLGQPHPELATVGRGSSCRATLSTSPCRCT
jgi:hypothetical protein